jgi:hypothetical protein
MTGAGDPGDGFGVGFHGEVPGGQPPAPAEALGPAEALERGVGLGLPEGFGLPTQPDGKAPKPPL